jgi:para-aminobenzoate synthetase component 1
MDAIAPHVTPGNADAPWYRGVLPRDLFATRANDAAGFRRGPLTPDLSRHTFEAMVQRVLDYIHAGDCYQVNLAHRLRATFEGDARALTLALLAAARPWYGCHLDIRHEGQRWTLSGASPERFLEISPPHADGTRTITTRPMKGTRRASDQGSHADLNASAKDRAELAMIVDLMRNDLGRVATLASVQVSQPRIIEEHGTGDSALLQTTATITATLAPSATLFDILRATFPPGSITGAPKIRAMQIIDELEHAQRGPYCGSVGYIGDDGSAQLNVAIRTALIAPPSGEPAANQNPSHYAAGSTLAYWVGAGIVADSTPASEWEETLAKASAIEAVGTGDWGSGTGVGERQ